MGSEVDKNEISKKFDGFSELENILSENSGSRVVSLKKVKRVEPKLIRIKKSSEERSIHTSDKSEFQTFDFPDFNDILKIGGNVSFLDLLSDAKKYTKFGTPEDILKVKIPSVYEEVESYWVNKPFAKVYILYSDIKNSYLYYLVEPYLTKDEKLLLRDIKEIIKVKLLNIDSDGKDKDEILENTFRSVLDEYNIKISKPVFSKLYYYLKRDFIGFYKIDGIMRDQYVEDVSCDGYNIPIFVYHWNYGSIPTNVKMDKNELDSFVVRLAQKSGKHISTSNPMVDATLSDGSRIQLTLSNIVTAHGSTFTIRKFKDILITPLDLIRWGTFSSEEMAYLWIAAENGKSILVVGGTASGKTTTLNAIALFIPLNAKIVTIEDTRELKLIHQNWIPGVTRETFTDSQKGAIDMYDLLKAALRQRPEYILVGEVRGREAQTLFQAMNTGHTTMSTLHADSVDAAIHRLEYPPISVPRSMIAALDLILIQSQVYIGSRRVRRNLNITEITGIDPITKNIKTVDLFEWDPMEDKHKFLLSHVYSSKVMQDIARIKAWNKDDLERELLKRKAILEKLVELNATSHDFVTFMTAFQSKPDEVTRKLLGDSF